MSWSPSPAPSALLTGIPRSPSRPVAELDQGHVPDFQALPAAPVFHTHQAPPLQTCAESDSRSFLSLESTNLPSKLVT